MDEGIVEGGEDTGNAEDELACNSVMLAYAISLLSVALPKRIVPSRTEGPREMFSWGARTLGGAIFGLEKIVWFLRLALIERGVKNEALR